MSAYLSEGRRINPPPVGGRSWSGQPPALTPREREVLVALARGATRKEVVASLCVSDNTIRTLMYRAFRKLGAASLVQAMNRLGWVRVPPA